MRLIFDDLKFALELSCLTDSEETFISAGVPQGEQHLRVYLNVGSSPLRAGPCGPLLPFTSLSEVFHISACV